MKHNAKKKTNSEKYNAKFEEHNAEILLMFWTINKQENHYTMDIKGTNFMRLGNVRRENLKRFIDNR